MIFTSGRVLIDITYYKLLVSNLKKMISFYTYAHFNLDVQTNIVEIKNK